MARSQNSQSQTTIPHPQHPSIQNHSTNQGCIKIVEWVTVSGNYPMSSLVFSSAKIDVKNRTLDLTTGLFYVHLVTAIPVPANSTVADLTLAAGGNYGPLNRAMANPSIQADGTGAKLVVIGNITFTGLTTDNAAPVQGVVLCKRTGANITPADPLICYCALTAPYTPPVTATDFTMIVPSTGLWKED